MPQMSPILWMNLYMIFTLTLVVFIAMFFYTKSPGTAPQLTEAPEKRSLNWKW